MPRKLLLSCLCAVALAAGLDLGSAPAERLGLPYVPPKRTKTLHCHARRGLPDRACTPGAVFVHATAARVCVPGYSASVRNVPLRVKRAAYAEYGITSTGAGSTRFDHLISLELGGSNSIANLWPEAASPRPGFHGKDAVENALHDRVCAGTMTLAAAQRLLATDWRDALATSG